MRQEEEEEMKKPGRYGKLMKKKEESDCRVGVQGFLPEPS